MVIAMFVLAILLLVALGLAIAVTTGDSEGGAALAACSCVVFGAPMAILAIIQFATS